MDSFEINKIITAILVTVLVVFGISKIADTIFEVKKPDVKGYKVEINSSSKTEKSAESQIDINALLAMGDIEHGKKVTNTSPGQML